MAEFYQILKEKWILILLKLFQKMRSRGSRFTLFHEASITWTPKQRLQEEKVQTAIRDSAEGWHPGLRNTVHSLRGCPLGAAAGLPSRRHTVLMGPRLSRRLASPVWHSEKAVHPEGAVHTQASAHGERDTLRELCTRASAQGRDTLRAVHTQASAHGEEKYCQPVHAGAASDQVNIHS